MMEEDSTLKLWAVRSPGRSQGSQLVLPQSVQWARCFTMHTSFLSYRRKPFVSSCLLKVPTDESLCALSAIAQW